MYDFTALGYTLVMDEEAVLEIVTMLLQPNEQFPYGSAFAVTAEPGQRGRRRIYLSHNSFTRLYQRR